MEETAQAVFSRGEWLGIIGVLFGYAVGIIGWVWRFTLRTNIKLAEHDSRITIQCESLKDNRDDVKQLKVEMQKEMSDMKTDLVKRLDRIENILLQVNRLKQ
jgi:hypothetical protein